MSINLYIVRHGRPLSNENEVGVPNPPLEMRGKKQAALTAAEIEKLGGVDFIYSSTFNRALETAEIIYEWFKVPWHVWPALGETCRKDWPDLRERKNRGEKLASDHYKEGNVEEIIKHSKEYIRDNYPLVSELAEQYPQITLSQPFDWPDIWWVPLVEETREIAYARAHKIIEVIKERHQGTDCSIALVCHAAFGSVLITVLTEGPPCDHNRFGFAHAAFSNVRIHEDGNVYVRFTNYVSHLYPHYLTG